MKKLHVTLPYLSKRMLFFPALLVGVLLMGILVKTRSTPEQLAVTERATPARVMTVAKQPVVPRVLGYGYVQAGQRWDAVAEVEGRIVATHPYLDKGAVIAKGELIARIDPAKRITARNRSSADVQSLMAELSEVVQKQKDTGQSLVVEKKSLKLFEKELARMQRLYSSGTVSRSEVDTAERQVLSQQNKVQHIITTLNSLPAEHKALQAKIEASRSLLQEAKLDLEKTEITAPFDCRITTVNIEKGQAVNMGQVLVRADSMNMSEAVAQMPLYLFRNVVKRSVSPPTMVRGGKLDADAVREFMDMHAVIRLSMNNDHVTWTGRVSRLNDSIDPDTRTLAVYVAVDEPYLQVEPGKKPPLLPNMFCEVELQGETLPPSIVVPRSAVRNGKVHVVSDNRLSIRPVEVDFSQGDMSVLVQGLEEGEIVVLSDLVPAIEGMLIKPVKDPDTEARLAAEASGAGAVR